jgi:hypothetical protein
VCNRVLQDMGEIEKVYNVQSQRIVSPPLVEGNMVVGFFMVLLKMGESDVVQVLL